jgi:hypothetical protein
MIRHLNLQCHCGVGQRLVKCIVDANFEWYFDAGLELGAGFKADLEITFPFYCR